MRRLKHVATGLFVLLMGCDVAEAPSVEPVELDGAFSFTAVVDRLAPVVQDTCEAADLVRNCKIRLYVAEASDGTANAFQSVDGFGRPFVLVTSALLEEVRNEDEVALILAHEAAHHILNHLERQKADAIEAAAALAEAAERDGASRQDVRRAERVGALVGARLYAQEYELEADALGAIILRDAGFNALRGAEFFFRIPDPGNHALNSHPSNAERRKVVRDAVLRNKLPEGALVILTPQS